ncbi:hypothetical protein B484DRAFT_205792 [Ochromonadaceae sp. CCMP2298]|nr:hypothetical protein B484DRAFT_205792 [Ochromonadaceae sp. CCMP2298]|mmetsp:Transcript_19183/g.42843  ORF Transcript_19183/g.42843 Transcript_19183/m.42843 type:complete len:188 (+) Transcript_19183:49-612(+)
MLSSTILCAVVCCLCLSSSHGLFNFGKKAPVKVAKKPVFPTLVIPKSYNVAAGFGATSAAIALTGNNVAAGAVAVVAAFITLQTGKVRFVFDADSMEVLINKGGKEEKVENLQTSRENFAVGGQNRWAYSSFTEWFFLPSRQLPILMYFTERQTDPSKDQLHLFPVIMDAQVLSDTMTQRVGPSSKA